MAVGGVGTNGKAAALFFTKVGMTKGERKRVFFFFFRELNHRVAWLIFGINASP